MTLNITFNVDHEEAAALLHFLRRVLPSDIARTLGSPVEVGNSTLGVTRYVWR